MRSPQAHAAAALRLLRKAEGEIAAAAAADIGVPEELTAAEVLTGQVRALLCKVFGWKDAGAIYPDDAP